MLKHTKELLEPIVKSSVSYAECLRKLGLTPAGGNYKNLQKNIDKYDIDSSHMLHQASNKGREIKKFENLLRPDSIKKRLIKYNDHKCQKCNRKTWNKLPIALELHHIDGDNRNNSKNNLELLCPNCHAQTHSWRKRGATAPL